MRGSALVGVQAALETALMEELEIHRQHAHGAPFAVHPAGQLPGQRADCADPEQRHDRRRDLPDEQRDAAAQERLDHDRHKRGANRQHALPRRHPSEERHGR